MKTHVCEEDIFYDKHYKYYYMIVGRDGPLVKALIISDSPKSNLYRIGKVYTFAEEMILCDRFITGKAGTDEKQK